jgi:hypothetical protein
MTQLAPKVIIPIDRRFFANMYISKYLEIPKK